MYSCNGRERLYACHVVTCRRISLFVKWNKERYSHMNSGVSSIIVPSGSCYKSAACYMKTSAVLYENVFESMSRPVTVS